MRRRDVVEAVHLVHVSSTDGLLHGDDVVSFLRSAAKPVQAIPLAEAYDDLVAAVSQRDARELVDAEHACDDRP